MLKLIFFTTGNHLVQTSFYRLSR